MSLTEYWPHAPPSALSTSMRSVMQSKSSVGLNASTGRLMLPLRIPKTRKLTSASTATSENSVPSERTSTFLISAAVYISSALPLSAMLSLNGMLRTSCISSPSALLHRAFSCRMPLTLALPFSMPVSRMDSCTLYLSTSSAPPEISSPIRTVSLASSTRLAVRSSSFLVSRSVSPDIPASVLVGAAVVTVSSMSITALSRSCEPPTARSVSDLSSGSASAFMPGHTSSASVSLENSDSEVNAKGFSSGVSAAA